MYTEEQYEAFQARMLEEYPKIFSQPFGGFAIGPGWWLIVDLLCSRIQQRIDMVQYRIEKYPEWENEPVPQVVVAQIKEKFGGLRFYYDGGDDYIEGLVAMAEDWANRTCEKCGKPGTKTVDGWVQTLCEKHMEERNAKVHGA